MSQASELRRAERFRRAGEPDKAAEALRAVLRERPTELEARRRLANLLAEMGDKGGAISEYVKVQEQLAAQRDILGAIVAGIEIVELDPCFDNPLAHLAKVKAEGLRGPEESTPAGAAPRRPPREEIPLLSELSPGELTSVAATMRRHEAGEDRIVFREGDEGESLYFVNEGLVEVKTETARLGLVSAGQCFGEFSFLTGRPRTATVRALEKTELLELSAEAMRRVAQRHPRLFQVLFKMYQDRALVNVLSLSPLFQVLPSKDRQRLASRFALVTLAPGETVLREGQRSGALYLVKDGSLRVDATIRGKTVTLAILRPHQFFGEVSFLTGVPHTATVHALDHCELLKIDEPDLRQLLRQHPYIAEVLSRYHLDRVTATTESLKAFLKRGSVEGILS